MSTVQRQSKIVKATHRLFFTGEHGELSQDGEIFLAELARFCFMFRPTIQVGKDGMTDVPKTMMAEGRREVGLRVTATLGLDMQKILRLEKLLSEETAG